MYLDSRTIRFYGFLDGAVRGYEGGFEVKYEHNKNLNQCALMAQILETVAVYQ